MPRSESVSVSAIGALYDRISPAVEGALLAGAHGDLRPYALVELIADHPGV